MTTTWLRRWKSFFAEREVKRGDLLVREGSQTDRVLFFEQGIPANTSSWTVRR